MTGGGTTNTQIHKTLKRILDLLKSLENSLALSVAGPDTSFPINLNALLSALNAIDGNTDGMEALTQLIIDELKSDGTDNIHTRLDTLILVEQSAEGRLGTISGNVDDLETLTIAANALMATIIAVLQSIDGTLGSPSSITNTHLSEIEDVLEVEILNKLTTIDTDTSKLTGIDADTNNIKIALEGAIQSELESIDQNWNLLSVNQLNLAAILAAVLNNSTAGKQDDANALLTTIKDNVVDIDNNTDTIETSLDAIEAEIELQCNHHWWGMLDITVNSIAGGTQVDLNWTPPVGSVIRKLKIEYLGITGNNTIEILLEDAGSTATAETVHSAGAQNAGVVLSVPENSAPTTERQIEVSTITEDLHVRVKITGVAAADQFEISLNGAMRGTVAPTYDSSNSTATITTITVLNQVR